MRDTKAANAVSSRFQEAVVGLLGGKGFHPLPPGKPPSPTMGLLKSVLAIHVGTSRVQDKGRVEIHWTQPILPMFLSHSSLPSLIPPSLHTLEAALDPVGLHFSLEWHILFLLVLASASASYSHLFTAASTYSTAHWVTLGLGPESSQHK